MKIDKKQGLLVDARLARSPNCDDRPDTDDISGIIIHNISLPPSQFGAHFIEDLFLNRLDCSVHPYFEQLDGLKVSSHILIKRDGEIIQFVPFHKRAWHAGVSQWDGRERCNDFTIGIELEGDDFSPFLEVQYRQCAAVIKGLLKAYPKLSAARIRGHEHIAPGRKTDPGRYFNWTYLRALVEA